MHGQYTLLHLVMYFHNVHEIYQINHEIISFLNTIHINHLCVGKCCSHHIFIRPRNRHIVVYLGSSTRCHHDPYQGVTLLKNKKFMLDEMTQRTASKFAIFHIYENQNFAFSVFHFVLLYFFP